MSPLLNKISSSFLDLSEVWTDLRSVGLLCLLALPVFVLGRAFLSFGQLSSLSASGSLPYSGELNVCQQINNLPALDGFSLFVLSFTFGITRQLWRVGRWTHLKMSSIKMNRNMMAPLLALKLFSKFLMQAALLIAAPSGDHFTLELRAVPFYCYKFRSQKTRETKLSLLSRRYYVLQHLPNLFDQHTQLEKKSKQARKKRECKF